LLASDIIGEMHERESIDNIKLVGKGRVEITTGGRKIVIEETAAPRRIEDRGKPEVKRKSEFPEGTLESLRPLLRELHGIDISEDADSYWLGIDKASGMSPKKAANILKRHGKGRVEVARALIITDESLGRNKPWVTKQEYNTFVEARTAEISEILRPYFSNKKQLN
jgi:hypothetical protein